MNCQKTYVESFPRLEGLASLNPYYQERLPIFLVIQFERTLLIGRLLELREIKFLLYRIEVAFLHDNVCASPSSCSNRTTTLLHCDSLGTGCAMTVDRLLLMPSCCKAFRAQYFPFLSSCRRRAIAKGYAKSFNESRKDIPVSQISILECS